MMIAKKNPLRGQNALKERKKNRKKFNSILKVFKSEEMSLLIEYLKDYKISMFFIALLSFFMAILEGSKALLLLNFIKALIVNEKEFITMKTFSFFDYKFFIDDYISINNSLELSLFLFSIIILITAIISLGKIFIAKKSALMEMHLLKTTRREFIHKIFSFDLSYYTQAKSGEMVYMMDRECRYFSTMINSATQMLMYGAQLVVYFLIFIYLSWDITLVIFTLVTVMLLLHRKIDRIIKNNSNKMTMAQNNISQMFYQIIYGMRMIKIASLEKREIKEYFNEHKDIEDSYRNIRFFTAISQVYREIFILFILFVSLFISYYIAGGADNKESIFSYFIVLITCIPILMAYHSARNMLLRNFGPIVRVVNMLKLPFGPDKIIFNQEIESKDKFDINNIKLKNISFKYSNEGNNILNNLSIQFEKNKMYAFVGYSGSGKSTLLDLLAGVFSDYNGDIYFNDIKLTKENKQEYKSNLSYMNQEPIIFHTSLKDNIMYFKNNGTEEEMHDAMSNACVNDFINDLPDGLDTKLGERGLAVSGGQRQRIGLSRVYLQNNNILLLDEVTNALDYKTENKVYENLKYIAKDKIVLLVAHRLSSLKNFDKIFYMDNGSIIESGSHYELMSQKGKYYSLFTLQNNKEENK